MSDKVYIGIDPGQTGAMALIWPGDAVMIIDYDDPCGVGELRSLWDSHEYEVVACIEKVHSMPKQGVVSSFKFGTNFGIWQGRLEILQIPYDFVTPQKWQKEMFDSMTKTDRKTMSLDRARRLFPETAPKYLPLKKHHNRAEALLIAEYCRRINQQRGD